MQGDITSSFANQLVRNACSSAKARKLLSSGVRYIAHCLYRPMVGVQVKQLTLGAGYAVLVVVVAAWLTGCGAGGYAGNGIASLSTSTITIDAGQSFQITAKLTGDEQVSWTMAGGSCSATA